MIAAVYVDLCLLFLPSMGVCAIFLRLFIERESVIIFSSRLYFWLVVVHCKFFCSP